MRRRPEWLPSGRCGAARDRRSRRAPAGCRRVWPRGLPGSVRRAFSPRPLPLSHCPSAGRRARRRSLFPGGAACPALPGCREQPARHLVLSCATDPARCSWRVPNAPERMPGRTGGLPRNGGTLLHPSSRRGRAAPPALHPEGRRPACPRRRRRRKAAPMREERLCPAPLHGAGGRRAGGCRRCGCSRCRVG